MSKSKIIETKICTFCESQYKISYDLEETSGYMKFCPFCGTEHEDEDTNDSDTDDNN